MAQTVSDTRNIVAIKADSVLTSAPFSEAEVLSASHFSEISSDQQDKTLDTNGKYLIMEREELMTKDAAFLTKRCRMCQVLRLRPVCGTSNGGGAPLVTASHHISFKGQQIRTNMFEMTGNVPELHLAH